MKEGITDSQAEKSMLPKLTFLLEYNNSSVLFSWMSFERASDSMLLSI